ncbi:hypothetical protein [Magnetospirillum molischianum]|uniref:Magnetosome membrane associated protein MmeA n=1 Tax=Magnetospirillum molischianum DSM 120 TaxID=1150626 RepID=H8FQP0_MAGML|nr:hypothetical protein [Magnetospirillum molischianum]CCG40678.1 conserved exported hypothetical protein [Magnetospirillum molischianum DSM 120]
MALNKTHAAAFCAALLAGGCTFAEDALFPGTANSGQSAINAEQMSNDGPPALGSSSFDPVGVTPGSSSGTYVGAKAATLRNDLQGLQATLGRQNQTLQQIRAETVQDSQRYHGTVAAINARLQVGTTPGNPILNQQWNAAQNELDRITDDVLKMNRLTNEVTASSTMAGYLLESVRAARSLSGAIDEDHRQLRILEDETNRTVVMVERLLGELTDDAVRQQQYVASEKQNLNTLALGIKNGALFVGSLSNQPNSSFTAPAPRIAAAPSEQPLVTIRFDKPNVNYEPALYAAVKSALDRRPNATFDVVAVAPVGANPGQQTVAAGNARRNAESVLRSLTNMNMPASRVRVSSSTSPSASASGEVQVFVR